MLEETERNYLKQIEQNSIELKDAQDSLSEVKLKKIDLEVALQNSQNQANSLKTKKDEDQDYLRFLKSEFEKESEEFKKRISSLEKSNL